MKYYLTEEQAKSLVKYAELLDAEAYSLTPEAIKVIGVAIRGIIKYEAAEEAEVAVLSFAELAELRGALSVLTEKIIKIQNEIWDKQGDIPDKQEAGK